MLGNKVIFVSLIGKGTVGGKKLFQRGLELYEYITGDKLC